MIGTNERALTGPFTGEHDLASAPAAPGLGSLLP
jgi:hypothetical protein